MYTYGIEDPEKAKIMAGKQPYLQAGFAETEILPATFVAGLTSAGTSGGTTLRTL